MAMTNHYFESRNYTGHHLHVDNYSNQDTPFIEAIAWVRQDETMDLFFNDFETNQERKALCVNKGCFYDEFMGLFLGNVKTDQEAYERFRTWVFEVLYPFRRRK